MKIGGTAYECSKVDKIYGSVFRDEWTGAVSQLNSLIEQHAAQLTLLQHATRTACLERWTADVDVLLEDFWNHAGTLRCIFQSNGNHHKNDSIRNAGDSTLAADPANPRLHEKLLSIFINVTQCPQEYDTLFRVTLPNVAVTELQKLNAIDVFVKKPNGTT